MVLSFYYLEVVLSSKVPVGVTVIMYRQGILQMILESFSKGPGGLSYIFLITHKLPTLGPVNNSTLLLHWVLVLRRHQGIFNSPVASEVGLYAILTVDFLCFCIGPVCKVWQCALWSWPQWWTQCQWCPGCWNYCSLHW